MPAADSPNVLFIISDQHRYDTNGFAGHPVVQTPNLDALAARSVRFDNAYCNSPVCVCSRASLLTGTYPHTNGLISGLGRGQAITAEWPTMGSVLRDNGYATGAFGKMHVPGETRDAACDLGFDERGMRIYTHWFQDYIEAAGEKVAAAYATYRNPPPDFDWQSIYNPTNQPIGIPDSLMYDSLVVDRCVDFMDRHRDRPFFLWAGLEKPHTDWTAPADYHRLYGPGDALLPPTVFEERMDMPEAWYLSTKQCWWFEEDEIRNCIAAYYANVTYLDSKIGHLCDALERLGIADNTIIVYTSDHGEMLFDHGMVQKQNFFEGSTHVPLLVRAPGTSARGTSCANPASLLDLFPTFCDLTGTTPPSGLEGISLSDTIQGRRSAQPRPVFSEYYSWGFPERMVRDGDWKYMYSHGQTCQLYNLAEDPNEATNLIDRPEYRDRQEDLHRQVMNGWEMPQEEALANLQGAWNDRDEWLEMFHNWKARQPPQRTD